MKISWLVLEVVFAGFFLYFGSSAALVLAVAMVLVPLVTLPVNIWVRKKVKLTVSAEPNLRKGSSGSFTLTVENPTAVPVFRMQCLLRTENQLNREEQRIPVRTWLPLRGKQAVTLQAGSDYCGRIKISAAKVTVYDCFGLIGISCPLDAAAYMTVQPDTFEMSVTMLPDSGIIDESEVYSEERPGNDMTETYQIREYVPGDSMRQIHWKLSNKFDRLIVRDPAMPVIQNVLVFWERTGESGNPEAIDAQAEIIVSLCKSLLDNSIQFRVGWNDTDRNLCVMHEINNTDELVGIVPRLMRATGSGTGVSGAELLLQTGGHALCSHMVYLAENPGAGADELHRHGHVTMLNGSDSPVTGAHTFDLANYKEQLSHIEL